MSSIMKIQGVKWDLRGFIGWSLEGFKKKVKFEKSKGNWNHLDPKRVWDTIQDELETRATKPTKKE